MRVVVITGASSGIGESIAVTLNQHEPLDFAFVLVARRKAELERVAASLTGSQTLVYPADVTVRANVDAVAAAAVERFGTIDIWVNCAGVGCNCVPSMADDELIDRMMTANVKPVVYGYQAALRVMKAVNGGRGHIINMSSILALMAQPNAQNSTMIRSAYAPAKAYIKVFTDLARQEADHDEATKGKLFITAVVPGGVATNFGLNAGSMDSRKMANIQPVEEVGEVVYQQAIVEKRPTVFTREADQAKVALFCSEMGRGKV